ncbi:MAG: N-acetylglucosamine-6-phosphate deacetylase [Erysipelotrichaceae bacterium]|nr:N-acetylglucosamine-6-phosphate deacetylase [Erysipelotrichaceae bacterium]
MILYSKQIITKNEIKDGYLIIENGKIQRIADASEKLTADIDASNYRIIPGIIDTHNHGMYGCRMKEGVQEEEVKKYLKGCASFGITSVFPTTFGYNDYRCFPLLAKMAESFQDGAQIAGIHSEGPFGARVGEKGINTGYPAVDMEHLKNIVESANGKLKLMGIAPEVDGALEAIKYLKEQGVTVAAYHTNANYEQANKGIDAGITVGTHTGNVMTGLHHRDIGTLGACLLRDEVYCELICDGLHISLPMIQVMLKVKPHDQIMMISDSVQYASIPQGVYRAMTITNPDSDTNELHVLENGLCVSRTGRLSGSTKPIIYGMQNLVEKLQMDIVEVCQLSSYNAARKYNLENKGLLQAGYDADFAIIDDQYQVIATYCLGKKVYDHQIDINLVNQAFIDTYKMGS